MRDFRTYTFWQDSLQLSVDIVAKTRDFPADEKFALCSQLRRSAVSIPSNIAEGAGRYSDVDFAHFLDIALGSAFEVETQLYIAQKLNYIPQKESQELINRLASIQRRLSSFINRIRGASQ